ncbi:unnamed protein product [Sphagnum balticum]
MPFDNTGKPVVTVQDVSALLRDRSRWPLGFVWNYGQCRYCALGLTTQYFGLGYEPLHWGQMAKTLGISEYNASKAFIFARRHIGKKRLADVTPEDVADILDSLV